MKWGQKNYPLPFTWVLQLYKQSCTWKNDISHSTCAHTKSLEYKTSFSKLFIISFVSVLTIPSPLAATKLCLTLHCSKTLCRGCCDPVHKIIHYMYIYIYYVTYFVVIQPLPIFVLPNESSVEMFSDDVLYDMCLFHCNENPKSYK